LLASEPSIAVLLKSSFQSSTFIQYLPKNSSIQLFNSDKSTLYPASNKGLYSFHDSHHSFIFSISFSCTLSATSDIRAFDTSLDFSGLPFSSIYSLVLAHT
jgi:hypothetical protein